MAEELPLSEPAQRRRVIADKKLGIANEIMRTLSELEPGERATVMQIVNLLVNEPDQPQED